MPLEFLLAHALRAGARHQPVGWAIARALRA